MPKNYRFRFSLRTLMIAITVVGVLIGLYRISGGVLFALGFGTLVLFVIGFRAESRNWRRVSWSYAAFGAGVSLLTLQLFLAHGLRVAGKWLEPNNVWAGLLIPTALGFVLASFLIASRCIRRGDLWARLACFPSTLPFLALSLLALSALCSAYSRMIFIDALFALRGNNGRYVYVCPRGGWDMYYENGLRESVWRTWDANGKVISQCEYRNDSPWEGVCQLYDGKAWAGEFKQGEPWNGYLDTPGIDEANFYVDGVIFTRAEYCQRHGIPDGDHSFIGIYHILAEPDETEHDSTEETRDASDSGP